MSQPIAIALVVVAAALALLVVGVAVLVRRDPEAAKGRVEALFRRPPKAPRAPGQDHYYRPYWS
jgi:hypothetical protein